MTHHHDPAQAFVEQVAERLIVGDRQNCVGQKFNLVALFGDQAAHQQIVGRTVFDGSIAPESGQSCACGGNRRPQRKLHSVKLTCDQNADVEVGKHADRLETFGECFLFDRNIKTGDSSHLGIGQRSNHGAQIVGLYSDVTVADYNHFVLSFADKAGQLHDFVVGSSSAGTEQHSNAALRKIARQLLQDGNNRVVFLTDAEKQLVIRIVLPAEAGEVFIRVRIQPTDRF